MLLKTALTPQSRWLRSVFFVAAFRVRWMARWYIGPERRIQGTGKAFGRQARCQASGVASLVSGRSLGIAGAKNDGAESVLSQCLWTLSAIAYAMREEAGQTVVKLWRLHKRSVSETCKTKGT